MTAPALRIGILGTAAIARQFVAGVAPSALVQVTAVASRDASRGEAFARDAGIARVFDSYEALLRDPEIDAIYNPLPNSLHSVWSIRAAQAGKHVLCEKPLAVNATEAKAMFAAARAHRVHVVEAFPYLAQPQTLKLRELLRAGAIGRVRHVQASIGFTIADPDNIRMVAALGGGARLDAGSYPVSLVRMVAGERPVRVHAVAQWFSARVEKALAATLEFRDGMVAQIICSFATAYHRHALIAGDAGAITTNYFNHNPPGEALRLQVRRGIAPSAPFETLETPGGNGFLAEADSFARLVGGQPEQWTGATPEESTDIMLMLDAIADSALSGASVELKQ